MEAGNRKIWRYATAFVVGVVVTVVAIKSVGVVEDLLVFTANKDKLAKATRVELKPDPVPSSWIISGSPKFKFAVYMDSPHHNSVAGTWECTGPGTFAWHYDLDEVIYVLDGSADIEYLGKRFTLRAGDSTRFTAGTSAIWHVTDHIRKVYSIHYVSRTKTALRKLIVGVNER